MLVSNCVIRVENCCHFPSERPYITLLISYNETNRLNPTQRSATKITFLTISYFNKKKSIVIIL